MIDTSAQNALKNSVYNFLGFLLPIAIMIVVTPIIIAKLGVKEYGIYIFLNTVVVFLGLLDLGVSVANSKHIIEYHSINREDLLKKLIYSMNSVYLILAFIYFFVCVCTGLVIQMFFLRAGAQDNYFLLFLIIGLTSFVGATFTNFICIITTIQRYDLQLKISVTFIVLNNLSMLILALLGYKLVPILLSQLLLALLAGLTYYWYDRKIFPVMRFKYAWDKKEILKNYKFGLSVTFNNLASSSLVHFDKLLVPIFLGNAQLTYYSVPGSIATKISNISDVFSTVLFPITVNLHSLNQLDHIRRVYIRSIRLITILAAAISFSIIFMADKILLYWLDQSFVKQSVDVLILLVMTNFVLALFNPLSNLLMAMNKMKFLTLGSVIMAVINIVALFILLPRYGINGAAAAYLIATLFIFYMFFFAERKYFGINHLKEHIKLYLKIFVTAIPFFAIEHFLLYPLITSFLTVIIIGPLCVVLYMLLYKLFGFFEAEDWNDFMIFFNRALNRFGFRGIKSISN